jgi:hypothetical protein
MGLFLRETAEPFAAFGRAEENVSASWFFLFQTVTLQRSAKKSNHIKNWTKMKVGNNFWLLAFTLGLFHRYL